MVEPKPITIIKKNSQEEIKQLFKWIRMERIPLPPEELELVLLLQQKVHGKKCRGPNTIKPNEDGFYESTLRSVKRVYSCYEIERNSHTGLGKDNYRLYPCYRDIQDKNTLEWWLLF